MNAGIDFDDFVQAYAETALWSSTDEDGEPLTRDIDRIAETTWNRMREDCRDFICESVGLLMAYAVAGRSLADAGHDFWLTRNRHGAGFWDRGLPADLGDALTKSAHAYGSVDLYVGDDGLIHGL